MPEEDVARLTARRDAGRSTRLSTTPRWSAGAAWPTAQRHSATTTSSPTTTVHPR